MVSEKDTLKSIEKLLNGEEFTSIPEFDKYVITKSGLVISKNYMRRGYPKILNPWKDKFGYSAFQLTRNDKKLKQMRLSRLLLICFVGNPPESNSEARHLDGNPRNNNLSNLAWGSPKENQQDRFRHGTDCAGSRSPTAKFTEEEVKEIRESIIPARKLAKKYGVYHTTILQIRKKKTWKNV